LSIELQNKVAEILEIQPIRDPVSGDIYHVQSRPIGNTYLQIANFCLLFKWRRKKNLMDYTCRVNGVGEPTADGLFFEVRGVECLGACGYAPMMQLGDFYQGT
jgi:NADH-quinone oxidoreductase subunit E